MPMNEWQLIGTAPNKTELLLYEKGHPFGPRMIGGCYNGKWLVPDLQCGGIDEAHPTHWMPLPEEP